MNSSNDKRLFLACFIALIATAFGFIVRAMIMDEWAREFDLTETQKGEIFGVGLWPFAVSIVLFSLVIDKVGYGRAVVIAFVCHIVSAVITIAAPLVLAKPDASPEAIEAGRRAGYWMLYLGNFIVALGNGTVEAFINPVVATMFSQQKTKWLNILHAGWPGGLVLGGVLAIGLGSLAVTLEQPWLGRWEVKVGLIFIPVLAYAFLMLGCKFPLNERVAAGVSYRDMLKEPGILGCLIVVALMVREIGRVFDWSLELQLIIGGVLVAGYGLYVQSLGRPMFIFLMLVMIPLATTELGTDSWITPLMVGEMTAMHLNPGWVLVYTSFIMMVLRFFAGPIVHKLSPLGLLAISSAIAALGLVSLSLSTGVVILLAATLYGFGKTFFWPTMLGVVSEQFPKGGALTLNMMGGVGMLSVGVIGTALLGNLQDRDVDKLLQQENPSLYKQVVGAEKTSVFGNYQALDSSKLAKIPATDLSLIEEVRGRAQKNVLKVVALLPTGMLICYLALLIYFRGMGGYKAEVLTGHKAEDTKFTGGVPGPVEA
jgi:MFS family permease